MPSQSNYPGTVENVTGTGVDWVDLDNVKIPDEGLYDYATATSAFSQDTAVIKATNFNFTLPVGCTVLGIIVYVSKLGDQPGSADYVVDKSVRLYKAGTLVGDDKATISKWPVLEVETSYGSSANLWGESWLRTDILNSGFGVAVQASIENDSESGDVTAYIDYIRIEVYYEEAPVFAVNKGIYTFTGLANNMRKTFKLIAESRALQFTGRTVQLRNWKLLANSGVFTLTGINVIIPEKNKLQASPTSFIVTQIASILTWKKQSFPDLLAYVLTGVTVEFEKNRPYPNPNSHFAMTGLGVVLSVFTPPKIFPEEGIFELTGISANALLDRVLETAPASLSLSGNAAVLTWDRIAKLNRLEYELSGIDARLIGNNYKILDVFTDNHVVNKAATNHVIINNVTLATKSASIKMVTEKI